MVLFDPHPSPDTDAQVVRSQGAELTFKPEFPVVISSIPKWGRECSLSAYHAPGTGLRALCLYFTVTTYEKDCLPPCHRQRKWGSERLNNLSKVKGQILYGMFVYLTGSDWTALFWGPLCWRTHHYSQPSSSPFYPKPKGHSLLGSRFQTVKARCCLFPVKGDTCWTQKAGLWNCFWN